MPRDLSDVIHYFIPDAEPTATPRAAGPRSTRVPVANATAAARTASAPAPAEVAEPTASHINLVPPSEDADRPATDRSATLPIVAVPIGDRDVVRAAFAWNLAVEVARAGGRGVVVTPNEPRPSPLWPEPGVGPMGAEIIQTEARDLAGLSRAALEVAASRAQPRPDGLVLVRVPIAWLEAPCPDAALLRWVLLFTSSARADLRDSLRLAHHILGSNADAQVGVTIHGARKRSEAEEAFTRLAHACQKRLGHDLTSYGLLVDDLHVYRAIVAQRPIGLAHPQSPAARALRDVAHLLCDDARKRARA